MLCYFGLAADGGKVFEIYIVSKRVAIWLLKLDQGEKLPFREILT